MAVPREQRDHYLKTIVVVEAHGETLTPSQVVERFGVPVAVITAQNPRSRELDPAENERRNAALLGDLDELGLPVLVAVGSNPEGTWSERGFAVPGLDRARALELGRAHGQNAIFEFDREVVWLLGCEELFVESRPLRGPDVGG